MNRDLDKLGRINKIIKTEATTTSISDFLITHVPFENLYLDPQKKKSISENELLENLLLKDRDTHKFIMVQGGNGSGKSHLIRWLKEKYKNCVDNQKEAVLLISRAHNTLQDALTQLLESDIFPQEIKERELRDIKNAKSNITGEELCKTINFNFTLEIDADRENNDTIIDKRTKDMLRTYLSDEYIQNKFLLIENGPIERIRAKIENVNDDVVNIGDDPMFIPEDFEITLTDIAQHLKAADTRASAPTIRIAELFCDSRKGPLLRQNVATYLNSKVSNVIQRSMHLQTADFKKLFAALRQNLKEQGMALTLFVEDINSFTGIDEALMEVLLTDHSAEGNEDYCRIISVVGSTNDFYNHKINASIKERINTNIYIDEGSVIGTPSQLSKFAARYINAINLEENQIKKWVENGADENDLPRATVNYDWASVDCNGIKLSIFPFNYVSLWNLFSSLTPDKRTPRVVLKSIIAHVLRLWYASPDTFLSNENNFVNADVKMPYWRNDNYKRGNTAIDPATEIERGILLRLWGVGTTELKDGKLGGVPYAVFEAFGVYAGFESNDIESKLEDNSSNEIEEPNTRVIENLPETKPIVEVKKSNKLIEIENQLRAWLNDGQTLSKHSELRDLLANFITYSIDWNVENVPVVLAQQYIGVRSRVHIEGQNISVGEGFVLPRNEDSYFLLVALANWKYMGEGSWDFEGGLDHLTSATAWLEKNKENVRQAVLSPEGKSETWNLSLWNIAALYCVKTLFGGIDTDKSSDKIMIDLFKEKPNYEDEYGHSEAWKDLQNVVLKNSGFKENIYSDALSYFSKSVGSAKPGETPYKFVDALEIMKQIRMMKKLDWDLNKIGPVETTENKGMWYVSGNFIKIFSDKIENILNEEKDEANKYLKFFRNALGDDFSIENINETILQMKAFLKFLTDKLNLNYDTENYTVLRYNKAGEELKAALNRLETLISVDSPRETLVKVSRNSFEKVEKYYKTFNYFWQELDRRGEKFNECVDTESKDAIAKYQKEFIEDINLMILQISMLGGKSNVN